MKEKHHRCNVCEWAILITVRLQPFSTPRFKQPLAGLFGAWRGVGRRSSEPLTQKKEHGLSSAQHLVTGLMTAIHRISLPKQDPRPIRCRPSNLRFNFCRLLYWLFAAHSPAILHFYNLPTGR